MISFIWGILNSQNYTSGKYNKKKCQRLGIGGNEELFLEVVIYGNKVLVMLDEYVLEIYSTT